jgi:hypothetical protein
MSLPMQLQIEHEFTLPMGYVDEEGTLHRHGKMRLATAADEILPLKDPRVQNNPAYLIVILLSRVIMQLGTYPSMNPSVVEGLFAADLVFLQDFYNQINLNGNRVVPVQCPHCQKGFEVEWQRSGES